MPNELMIETLEELKAFIEKQGEFTKERADNPENEQYKSVNEYLTKQFRKVWIALNDYSKQFN